MSNTPRKMQEYEAHGVRKAGATRAVSPEIELLRSEIFPAGE